MYSTTDNPSDGKSCLLDNETNNITIIFLHAQIKFLSVSSV